MIQQPTAQVFGVLKDVSIDHIRSREPFGPRLVRKLNMNPANVRFSSPCSIEWRNIVSGMMEIYVGSTPEPAV